MKFARRQRTACGRSDLGHNKEENKDETDSVAGFAVQFICKGWCKSKAEFVLLTKDGDILYHTQTNHAKNAMKDVCQAIGMRKK